MSEEKSKIPNKLSTGETLRGLFYSILIWLAYIIMAISIITLLCYYFSFILKWDFFNPEVIRLSIYFVIGCFFLVFVYDKAIQKKWNINKKDNKNEK